MATSAAPSTEVLSPEERGYVFYTPPELDREYVYDATKGETFLDSSGYALTGVFIDFIISGPILPTDILETFDLDDIDAFVDTLLEEWGTVFTYNWKLCVCAIFGLIMTIVMPILGIAWCCMHRRGKWGGGTTEYKLDWKSSVVRQISLSFYMALWALSLWGLVWHFAADQLMADGFRDLPRNIDIIISDTQQYLNNTHAQAVHWSEVNFEQELKPGFGNAVNNMAWGMQGALYQINEPEYTGMNRITGLPGFLTEQLEYFMESKRDEIGTNLEELHGLGVPIYQSYLQLKSDEDAWASILSNCHPMCEQIQLLGASFIYRVDLISYPDVVSHIEVTDDDYETIDRMWNQTVRFEYQLARLGEDFIADNMDTVDRALEGMEDYFVAGAAELELVTREMLFEDPGVAEDAEEMFEFYFDMAYYAFLVPAILMTIILAVYLVGYFLGLLSKVGSTNRKKYASDLMYSGTLLFFVFSFVFWLLTTLLFVSGTAIQKLYCDTLEEPEDSELYVMFEDEVNEALVKAFNNTGFEDTTWDIPRMLDECEQGKSLYEILHLDDAYDVRSLRGWRAYVDVREIEAALLASLGATVYDVAPHLNFTDPDLENDMLYIQNKTLPIVDKYIDDYMDHYFDDVVRFTTVANLSDALAVLRNTTEDNTVQGHLDDFLLILDDMLAGMPAFEDKYYQVKAHAEAYDVEVTYTTISVYEVIDDAFQVWYPVSQDQLINNWQDILGEELIEDYEDCVALFDWFADYSSGYLGEDLGECTDMFGIYEAAINYSCYELVDPLNSVWSGMGLILVCFIPMLLCAMKIEGIFRAEKPDLTDVANAWAHTLDPIQEKEEDSMEKAPANFSSSSSDNSHSMSKEMEEVKPL